MRILFIVGIHIHNREQADNIAAGHPNCAQCRLLHIQKGHLEQASIFKTEIWKIIKNYQNEIYPYSLISPNLVIMKRIYFQVYTYLQ